MFSIFWSVYSTVLSSYRMVNYCIFPLKASTRNFLCFHTKKISRTSLAPIILGLTQAMYMQWQGHMDIGTTITVYFEQYPYLYEGTTCAVFSFFVLLFTSDFLDQLNNSLFDFTPDYPRNWFIFVCSLLSAGFYIHGGLLDYMHIQVHGTIGELLDKGQENHQGWFDHWDKTNHLFKYEKYSAWFWFNAIFFTILPSCAIGVKILNQIPRINQDEWWSWFAERIMMFYIVDVAMMCYTLQYFVGHEQDKYFVEHNDPPPCKLYPSKECLHS
eukprot:UN31502